MSASQAAAITACTACAAVGGAAAGGAFSSGTSVDTNNEDVSGDTGHSTHEGVPTVPPKPTEVKWFPLKTEIATNSGDYESKIGKEYQHILVGTYGTENNSTNQWWKKSYDKHLEDRQTKAGSAARTFSDTFSANNVTSHFESKEVSQSGSTSKALNKVCDSVYKKNKTDIEPGNPDNDQTKTKLRDDLWRYCSPLGTRPVYADDTTDGITTTQGKIGETKKSVVLSTKANVNVNLWDIKQKEFFALSSVSETYFNALHSQINTKESVANSLRDKCNEAYGLTKAEQSSTSAPTEAEVEKYCSIKAMSS